MPSSQHKLTTAPAGLSKLPAARETGTLPKRCEDCDGMGMDVGSLAEPEACKACLGAGYFVTPEPVLVIRRKRMGKASRSFDLPYLLDDTSQFGNF